MRFICWMFDRFIAFLTPVNTIYPLLKMLEIIIIVVIIYLVSRMIYVNVDHCYQLGED